MASSRAEAMSTTSEESSVGYGSIHEDSSHSLTLRRVTPASGPASIMAIGIAVPPHVHEQTEYPDFFFNITNCNHKPDLKQKFQRICEKSGIKKRHFYMSDDRLREHPSICTYKEPSLDIRQQIAIQQVPKLAQEASLKAIAEWGRPKQEITHIVFATTSGVNMPGADHALAKLLGLRPTVKRTMLYQIGCYGGATALRMAKDLAENNRGARVLVVASEITCVTFRAPDESHVDGLVGSALFGDGASAVIVGSDPKPDLEEAAFEICWSGETILPDSDGAIDGHLTEAGLMFHLLKDVPGLISKNIDKNLQQAKANVGSPDYQDMFWAVHPGGPAILDQIERKLKLDPSKLAASREILEQYGNMSSATVLFVLDRIHQRSILGPHSTTGESSKYGFVIGFGPGLTLEVLILKALPL
ncbi:chalcone synthase [Marchantia polymorpha subsp. ruderalis]|nr:hypothetical protein MARPO_0040s0121 [Marchantia polymorpha]BBN03123.1 hypothetical protein Mp_2g20910 [Marchantia polymorpha subsp. ruderalis]|eukprot:PTQ40452.1 hypothetical protein MARPO_0040s0121 [Marchantia polymorpha]